MSTFTYPGVYIQELSSGVHTITGVATSIAAFVGWADQGPVTEATLVESWPEYEALFGGFDSRSRLGYAVNQFFANGGSQAYIVRLVWDGSLPPASGTSPAPCATAAATGVGFASTQIQAAVGSIVSNLVTLYVGTPVLESISISPSTLPPIPSNAAPLQFTATGTNSDGSPASTLTANWSSSDSAVMSISSAGKATVIGAGSAILSATDPTGLVSASIPVTVTPATLSATTGITLVPNPLTIASGQTQQLAATGKYSDGTTQDLTSTVAWKSLSPAEATFSPTTAGLLMADNGLSAAGTVVISASWAGATASETVNVNPPALTSIVISPSSPTLVMAQALTFTAAGIVSYNPPPPPAIPSPPATVALTGATWSSSNVAVATIDNISGAAVAVAPGSTTITVTSSAATGSIVASTTLTVTAASVTLNSISVTPANFSLAEGLTQQMKSLGTYSDGSTADLTGSAVWSSSLPADASITASGGLVAAKTVTSTAITITALWGGVTGTATLTSVLAPVLESITITPPPAGTIPSALTIPSGSTQHFTATGNYSAGPTQDLTTSATWSSSTPAAATVVASGATAGLASAVAPGGSLTLFANNPGSWGNSLQVSISVLPPPNSSRFNILVQQVSSTGVLQTLESFVNLSISPLDPQGNYVVTVIDNDSNYITFVNPKTGNPVVPTAAPSPTSSPIALSGGADGGVLTPTDHNFEAALLNGAVGVYLLDRVDIFNLLCIPAETDMPTISLLQQYCNQKRAFYIVDPPQNTTFALLNASGPAGTNTGSITGQYSINSAFYFPWVQAPDPLFGGRPTLFPPCGFVAGIYAATDATRGVWKAPAGINASLTGVNGLQFNLTDTENGDLNIQGINCLRQFKTYGDVVWGARTLQGSDQAGSQWKYVPIRRLALYIESSLYDGTQWVVFEPNDEPLWGQIRLNVGTFMQGLFLQGAFEGTTPQQAYFVKCDSENNPQSSIDLGVVNIQVGFAPLYPAEFVVIQIVQMAGQSS